MKTTFEILGKGFVKVINDGFDFMVTTLLEGIWGPGGREFGQAVLETIKAGLRDVIGEAIKARIQEAFASIFAQKEDNPVVKGQVVTHGKLDTLNTTMDTIGTKIVAAINNQKNPNAESGITSFKETINQNFPDVIKAEIPSVESILGEVKESIVEGTAATKDGFLKNLLALGKILFSLAKDAAGGVVSIFSKIFGGATGGMLPGSAPLAQFAQGGITKAPQLAVIGEGRNNEAVVPLPNNREIPVDLKGASGDTITIEQNFDFSNADNSAIPRLRAEARAIEERTFNRVFTEINKGGRYSKIVGRR